jgi:tetratricopeptide (TPR) repeat protein
VVDRQEVARDEALFDAPSLRRRFAGIRESIAGSGYMGCNQYAELIRQVKRFWRVSGLAGTLVLAASIGARADPQSDALRARASDELYNLDDERALATWREATTADPQDAAAWRGLASGVLAHIAMLRGTMTVDSYLGRVAGKDVAVTPPPARLAEEFQSAAARAIALARQQVAARPTDVQAQYELGAAVALRASYMATVEGGVLGAFQAAREAYDAHEKVLEMSPARADAGLIVGTYRYLVATLSMPARWVAYIAGFGGGKDRGVKLVEAAAAYRGDNQSDARLALVLLYNRERRFEDALTQLEQLRRRYPRNRLFWLETGSTLLRAGRALEAERTLNEGMAMLVRDTRPRMFGEDALWYYRRGAARAALGRRTEAQGDLNRALTVNGRKWVEGRAHLELGRLALLESNPVAARDHFQAAARLGDSDRDGASAERARELLKQVTASR